MPRHIEVIKLVAEVAVVADAGEDVQQQFGGAEADQDANSQRRKRRNTAFLIKGMV